MLNKRRTFVNILKKSVKTETIIKGSRFISEAFPVKNQQEAREILRAQKEKYADATHVVHAFIAGETGGIMGMSDDGEPSGTAGRPALEVLKGSGITNILLTITRYFGGTLLGTGGLSRAYSGGAKEVLAIAETEPLVAKSAFSFSVSYDRYDAVKRAFKDFHIDIASEDFGTEITVNGTIFLDESQQFAARVFDITQGKSTVTF